jgi:hypothetical protein
MVQSPHFGECDDGSLLRRFHPPGLRSIFAKTQMTSAGVIISEITYPDEQIWSA